MYALRLWPPHVLLAELQLLHMPNDILSCLVLTQINSPQHLCYLLLTYELHVSITVNI